MKHVKKMTVVRRADAFNDFLNEIWRAWTNYQYEKKNSLA